MKYQYYIVAPEVQGIRLWYKTMSLQAQLSTSTRGPQALDGLVTVTAGKAGFLPDGSYVTTRWFSIMMVPLLPIRSYRVLEGRNLPNGSFRACLDVGLQIRQILNVYLFMAFTVGWLALAPLTLGEYFLDKPIWLFLGALALSLWMPAVLLRTVRRRARRRSKLQEIHEPQAYRARA